MAGRHGEQGWVALQGSSLRHCRDQGHDVRKDDNGDACKLNYLGAPVGRRYSNGLIQLWETPVLKLCVSIIFLVAINKYLSRATRRRVCFGSQFDSTTVHLGGDTMATGT